MAKVVLQWFTCGIVMSDELLSLSEEVHSEQELSNCVVLLVILGQVA